MPASKVSCIRTRWSSSGACSSCSIPYITGLVAGAFILASLERVFNVEAVKPTYRLALLTALAFLLVAPLPLQLHLGHPERSLEMYLTPHTHLRDGDVRLRLPLVPDGGAACSRSGWTTGRTSCWLAQTTHRPERWLYGAHARRRTTSARGALAIDDEVGWFITLDRHPLRVPAARLRRLHLRVGQGQPLVVRRR